MNDQTNLYSFQVYHATGLKVFFAFPFASFAEANTMIADALAAGFTVDPRGVEEGEIVVEASAIGRKQQFNADDATYSPVLVLYADKGNFNVGRVYLNDDSELAAARHALGMDIMQIPLYDGEGYIERGKDPNKDKKYIAHLPHTVKAIFKKNPKYNPNPPAGEKKKPQYLFVRWHSAAPAPQAEQQPADKPATPKTANGTPPTTGATYNWTPAEIGAFVKWLNEEHIAQKTAFEILGVQGFSQSPYTPDAAREKVRSHHDPAPSGEPSDIALSNIQF